MRKIVVIGATSGIGRGLALGYAELGDRVAIVGRRGALLDEMVAMAPDKFISRVCDVTNIENIVCCLDELLDILNGVDILIYCSGVGELNPELDFRLEEGTIHTNIVGFTVVADWAVNNFIKQGSGHFVAISSVGGIRGSGMAPAYNASKAYQINYLEALHQKVTKLKLPIFVTDIRPGFVSTAMAKGEGLFWVAPIGRAVYLIMRGVDMRKRVVYVTRRWRLVAFILKIIPSFLYSKM